MIRIGVPKRERDVHFIINESISKRFNAVVSNFIGTKIDFGQCLYEKVPM